MSTYRSVRRSVRAMQWDGDWSSEWREWLGDSWVSASIAEDILTVRTLNGTADALPGWWVVEWEPGRFSVSSPGTFARLREVEA